jgi:hypothetical protein
MFKCLVYFSDVLGSIFQIKASISDIISQICEYLNNRAMHISALGTHMEVSDRNNLLSIIVSDIPSS